MPTIKHKSSLAANGTDTPLAGSQYEFLPFNARVEFSIICGAGGKVVADVSSGTDILMQNADVDEKAVTLPITYPEDYQVDDVVAAGERISVKLRETAGAVGPTVVRTTVRITPI